MTQKSSEDTGKTSTPGVKTIPLQPVDAGDFATWLQGTRATQLEGKEADVPCGDCNGCCKSFYFIHIAPNDTDALEVIPRELLVEAPGLPTGHFVMGYNDQGHCPMLREERCTIYQHRPQTCRAYDCRIFTASDMQPGETDKALVRKRTAHWAFDYKTATDRTNQQSIARAARWLTNQRNNPDSHLPANFIPSNSTQLAVLAIELRELFTEQLSAPRYTSKAHAEACVALNIQSI